MNSDFFESKAESYEEVDYRVVNVENIANSILVKVEFNKSMQIMDFGSGTGLLLERIAPFVKKIAAVDISKSMNEQLNRKREWLDCELDILEINLSDSSLDKKYDVIISSMTMHHVRCVELMFYKFYAMLNNGGKLAIADLDVEDGSFHTEDTGVFHFGFDRKALSDIAEDVGFKSVEITTASTVCKPQGNYPVFLLTCSK